MFPHIEKHECFSSSVLNHSDHEFLAKDSPDHPTSHLSTYVSKITVHHTNYDMPNNISTPPDNDIDPTQPDSETYMQHNSLDGSITQPQSKSYPRAPYAVQE